MVGHFESVWRSKWSLQIGPKVWKKKKKQDKTKETESFLFIYWHYKKTTNSRPMSEDNPTVHHPLEMHRHLLQRSLKTVNPCLQSLMLTWAHLRTPVVNQGLLMLTYSRLLLVSYLFIHYHTISLFITALFVTYLHHILYSYIYTPALAAIPFFPLRIPARSVSIPYFTFLLHVMILTSDPCWPDCLGHSCPYRHWWKSKEFPIWTFQNGLDVWGKAEGPPTVTTLRL